MRSPLCAAVLAAAVTLLLTACVTSKEAYERQVRIDEIHAGAPEFVRLNWDLYLTQAQGRYGILALDEKVRGMGWIYCVGACHRLLGDQNPGFKAGWMARALEQCQKVVRRDFPAEKPDCAIYAIRDQIVWEGALPWEKSPPITFTPEARGE